MFGEVVGFVGTALAPKYVELFLMHMIADPIKVHVNGHGSLLFDSVIGDTSSCTVVSLDRRWRLWVPQFLKSGANGTCLLAVVE